MDVFYMICQQTIMVAVAITMVSLGGMFSERSGVINIALEGIMIIGAFCGMLFIKLIQDSGSTIHPQILLLIALAVAATAGGIYSLLLAFASINMKADQTIGGTALNIIAPAFAIFISRTIFGTKNIEILKNFFIRDEIFLSKIPVIGDIFFKNTYITVYVGIIIWIIAIIVLYKTKFGLRLRSCGEHPQAADSVGINVYKMRYSGVIISGVLGGIGGLMFIICTVGSFGGSVLGYGFLALAVMIFGQWKPVNILLAAIFFALMGQIGSFYSAIPFLKNLGIPSDVYKMLPYIATLVVLAFTSKKSRAPKAEGVPYDKGER